MIKQYYTITICVFSFLLFGLMASSISANAKPSECENDTCVQLTMPDGSIIPGCSDASSVPGSQEGWDCDAGGSSCTMYICGI